MKITVFGCIFLVNVFNVWRVYGQFLSQPLPPRPTLVAPVPNLCENRVVHAQYKESNYFFSWRDPGLRNTSLSWLDARSFCRQRCMDLASIESGVENKWLKDKVDKDHVRVSWTSGVLCYFQGCDQRPDLFNQNVWFWSATLTKLAPISKRDQNDWSDFSHRPDPREPNKNCLALVNVFPEGTHWHDVDCNRQYPFVCEDNKELLEYVRITNPTVNV